MGFGAGAFFMGKIAPPMVISMGVANTFYIWGVIFLVLVTASAQLYKNPPKGWLPAGFTPKAAAGVSAADSYTFDEAVKTPQWWMLWAMLFLNVSAGLGLISQLSPMAQDVLKKADPTITAAALALAGGSILAYASIFNGLGRLFWAWTSDAIGRRNVFITMFITQAVALHYFTPHRQRVSVTLLHVIFWHVTAAASLPCRHLPQTPSGPAYIGKVYGIMLTAWGAAGIVGPLVFAAIKGIALYVAAGLLIVGLLLALGFKRPKRKEAQA